MSIKLFGIVMFLVLAVLAMRGARWAYAAFVVLLLLYFPWSRGFHLDPQRCYLTVDLPLAIQSLSNFAHITMFSIFFLMTMGQLRMPGWQRFGWSIALTMAMGVAVEIAEGLSGAHHCKTVDLIPDFIGALLGLMAVVLGGSVASVKLRRRNGDKGTVGGGPEVG